MLAMLLLDTVMFFAMKFAFIWVTAINAGQCWWGEEGGQEKSNSKLLIQKASFCVVQNKCDVISVSYFLSNRTERDRNARNSCWGNSVWALVHCDRAVERAACGGWHVSLVRVRARALQPHGAC